MLTAQNLDLTDLYLKYAAFYLTRRDNEAVSWTSESCRGASESRRAGAARANARREKSLPLSSTLELPLALGRLQGGTEVLQVSTLSLVHEVEELPEHRDRQRAKGHLRHKQPNAKSAHFKRQQEKFYILESFTTVRKWKEDFHPHITTTFPTHT